MKTIKTYISRHCGRSLSEVEARSLSEVEARPQPPRLFRGLTLRVIIALLLFPLWGLGGFACQDDITPMPEPLKEETKTEKALLTVQVAVSGSNKTTRQTADFASSLNLPHESAINGLEIFVFEVEDGSDNFTLEDTSPENIAYYALLDFNDLDEDTPVKHQIKSGVYTIEDIELETGKWYRVFVMANGRENGNYVAGLLYDYYHNVDAETAKLTWMDIIKRGGTAFAHPNPFDSTTPELIMVTPVSHPFQAQAGHNIIGDPALFPGHTPAVNTGTGILPLERAAARVALVNLTTGFEDKEYTRFELHDIAMFNVRAYFGVMRWAMDKTEPLWTPPLTRTQGESPIDFRSGANFPSSRGSYVGYGENYNTLGENIFEHGGITYTYPSHREAYPMNYSPANGEAEDHFYGYVLPDLYGLPMSATFNPALVPNINGAIINVTDAPYFYVNENTSGAHGGGTFITIRGKLYDANNNLWEDPMRHTDPEGYTYYTVWINRGDMGYDYTDSNSKPRDGSIQRNTQYNISIELQHAGNPSIDNETVGEMKVSIGVAEWKPVTQTSVWR